MLQVKVALAINVADLELLALKYEFQQTKDFLHQARLHISRV